MRLTVDLVTDFSNPACWLVATHLGEAIARLPADVHVRVRWLPFWEADGDATPPPPATFAAHRLMRLAVERKGGAAAARLARALFAARFIHERDFEDPGLLAALAVHAGLPEDEVEALLSSDAKAAEVRAFYERLRAAGVTAAPILRVGGQAVAGVTDASMIEDILFGALAAQRAGTGGVVGEA